MANDSPVYNALAYLAINKAIAPINTPRGKKDMFLKLKFNPIARNDLLSVLYNNQVAINNKIADVNGKYCFKKGVSIIELSISAKAKSKIANAKRDSVGYLFNSIFKVYFFKFYYLT